MTVTMIGCSGGCGLAVLDPVLAGWERLEITGRYRCGECTRKLEAMRHLPGTHSEYKPDTLPPHSRGALKELPLMPPLKESPRGE